MTARLRHERWRWRRSRAQSNPADGAAAATSTTRPAEHGAGLIPPRPDHRASADLFETHRTVRGVAGTGTEGGQGPPPARARYRPTVHVRPCEQHAQSAKSSTSMYVDDRPCRGSAAAAKDPPKHTATAPAETCDRCPLLPPRRPAHPATPRDDRVDLDGRLARRGCRTGLSAPYRMVCSGMSLPPYRSVWRASPSSPPTPARHPAGRRDRQTDGTTTPAGRRERRPTPWPGPGRSPVRSARR